MQRILTNGGKIVLDEYDGDYSHELRYITNIGSERRILCINKNDAVEIVDLLTNKGQYCFQALI